MKLSDAYEGCDSSHAAILVAHQPRAAKMALDSQHSIQLVLSGALGISLCVRRADNTSTVVFTKIYYLFPKIQISDTPDFDCI